MSVVTKPAIPDRAIPNRVVTASRRVPATTGPHLGWLMLSALLSIVFSAALLHPAPEPTVAAEVAR